MQSFYILLYFKEGPPPFLPPFNVSDLHLFLKLDVENREHLVSSLCIITCYFPAEWFIDMWLRQLLETINVRIFGCLITGSVTNMPALQSKQKLDLRAICCLLPDPPYTYKTPISLFLNRDGGISSLWQSWGDL